jgi:hypothetical protein
MTLWVAAITCAILPKDGALDWELFAPFALIAVVVVTAVFWPAERTRDDAQKVLRILFGRRPG